MLSAVKESRALNCAMVVLARESRGYTQSALAKAMGMAQGTLSKIENGQLTPPTATLEQIADFLGYEVALFFDDYDARNLPISFYRKRVRVAAGVVKAIRARVNLIRLNIRTLLRSVDVPELRLPFINLREHEGKPEVAAREVRLHLGIPSGPIPNLTRILEDAGVVVARCDFGTRQIDALTMFTPEDDLPPVIFVNALSPGDRLRFSLAHEVAHAVLHLATPPRPEDDIESEANLFAAEFLTPRASIRPYLSRPTLVRLASLKPYWKVSMRCLIEQAVRVGQINERQRRYLHMQMAKAGYLDTEPNPIEIEQSSLLQEIVQCHMRDLGYSETELGQVLRIKADELKSFYVIGRTSLRVVSSRPNAPTLRPLSS